jgi:transposase
VKNSENGRLVLFCKRTDGAREAGASVTKTATLLGVSRVTVSKVMSAYMNHGKTSAKRNNGQKSTLTESSYVERGCFGKSHNYCSTGDRIAGLNIHFEDPVSTKTIQCELHKSNIHDKVAIAIPLITESNA